jgi:MFS family permease
VRRLVLLCSAIVFVDTTFYAVVAPLLPSYVDRFELSKVGAGVLAASNPLGTLVGAVPCGLLAVRVGPKRLVLLGLGLLAASSLVFAWAQSIALLDAARFAQGIAGSCAWAGALAWLLSEAPAARRGAVLGTALGAGIAGVMVGPAFGGLAEITSHELVFSSVVVVAGALACWAVATPETRVASSVTMASIRRAARRPGVLGALWLVTLPTMGYGAMNVVASLRLDHLGAGTATIAGTFLVAAGAEALMAPLVGRVSDRRGRLWPLRGGLVASAVVLATIALPHATVLLALGVVLLGSVLGVFLAPAMAMVADEAERAGLEQAFALSLVNVAWALGQVSGSVASGALAQATSDAVPFLALAALCLLTLRLLTRLGLARPRRTAEVGGRLTGS